MRYAREILSRYSRAQTSPAGTRPARGARGGRQGVERSGRGEL